MTLNNLSEKLNIFKIKLLNIIIEKIKYFKWEFLNESDKVHSR